MKRNITTATEEEKQDLMALSRAIEAICKRNKNQALSAINEVIAAKQQRIAQYDYWDAIARHGVIKRFFVDKATEKLGNQHWYNYPMQYIDNKNHLHKGYIKDARVHITRLSPTQWRYELTVIVLKENLKDHHTIEIGLISAKCEDIMWDALIVHNTTTLV